MKKAFVILFLLGLGGCQYHDSSVPASPRIDFKAAKDGVITAGDPSFQIVVILISESRCPKDVVCIWAGEASATFQPVSPEYLMKGTFSLKIGESKIFSMDHKNYQLTLTDVTPYPSTENANEEKKAVFTIKPL